MSDITKCADNHCPSRGNCLRFCAPSAAEQSFADFGRQRRGSQCSYYIHVSDKDKRSWQRGSAKVFALEKMGK